MLVCMTACGGSNGGGGGESTTGSILITLAGLPDGSQANASLMAPNGTVHTIHATQTVTNLIPGSYQLAVNDVLANNIRYLPQPATQSINVTAGTQANATVQFRTANTQSLTLRAVISGLSSPVYLTAPSGDSRLFVVEQAGRIRIVKSGVLLTTPFLDIRSIVASGGERGLLSMAFDPDYTNNGLFYVYFTDLQGNIAIQRYQVASNNADLADPNSGLRILSIARNPALSNHNGGLLHFGPDNMLYLGTGDGGGGGDPAGNGQKLSTLLGKLLRIDVRNATTTNPYRIPPDNPFVSQAGKLPEIWAYGLRNPWRFTIDFTSNTLFIADVGQNEREEVNAASIGQAGLNYGWNITEGTRCYPSGTCDTTGQTLPVLEYNHNDGCSITGGVVYRGNAISALQGHYFYSDYCSGWLKSFAYRNGAVVEQTTWPVANVGNIVSFGQDGQQEVYLLSSKGGTIYQIAAN